MKKGVFLTFEGIDGSGKTTQLHLLVQGLLNMGQLCCETREPTNGPVGAVVNQILQKRLIVDERVTATLFAGDRLDHLLNEYNGICKKINSGVHVISDRYYLSSYAYNSAEAPLEWVMQLNEQAAQILKPAAHIFVDVSPEVAVKRILTNRQETELYETMEQLTAIRKRFFDIFELVKEKENVIIVNGDLSPEQVAEEIWSKVQYYFE